MDIIKFIFIAIIASFLILIVKKDNKDMGLILSIVSGAILLLTILDSFSGIFSNMKEIFEKTKLSGELLNSMIKIIGIAYVTEFGAGICDDSENKSLGEKVRLFGKITILITTLPMISQFLSLLSSLY